MANVSRASFKVYLVTPDGKEIEINAEFQEWLTTLDIFDLIEAVLIFNLVSKE